MKVFGGNRSELPIAEDSFERIMNGSPTLHLTTRTISRSHREHYPAHQLHLVEDSQKGPLQLLPSPASQLVLTLRLPSLYTLGTIILMTVGV